MATPRLDLLPLAVGHAPEMAEVLSDQALHQFTGGRPDTPEELLARYRRLTAGSPDPDVVWWNWVVRVRAEGRLAGTVQATVSGASGRGPRTAELAWVIGTAWQGRGYATEAARALAGRLADEGVAELVAHIDPEHAASAAVAAAVGLRPTDRFHDGERRWQTAVGG